MSADTGPPRRVTAALKGLRSARALLIVGCVLLILLPLLFLGLGYAYERLLVHSVRRDLQGLAQEVSSSASLSSGPDLSAAGQRAWALLLDRDGRQRADSGTVRQAMDASYIGLLAEKILGGLWAESSAEALDAVERELGPLAQREEVRRALSGHQSFAERLSPSGRTVVFHLAAPLPGGGALYLIRGSRRGLRQLFLLRHELLKVTLYECVFALLLGVFLSRRLVHPLELLARAARRYPREPLGDERLLARRDELGELARAIRALAEDLEARRRATADLGADVAHEFKNPLAIIAASVELLTSQGGGASPERIGMVASHVQEAVGRLRRSLDALLSLLRLEATLKDEPREAVPYAELLAELLADYRRDPRWAEVALRAECAADVGQVWIVPHRWEEMLRNLLDNALVQPAARREVIVRARREGEVVITEVQDFGPGVSAGNRDKIFRRFFTQRPAGAPAGTGLGLSIVQAVAEAHGGKVTVRSGPEGQPAGAEASGATFAVSLPAPL